MVLVDDFDSSRGNPAEEIKRQARRLNRNGVSAVIIGKKNWNTLNGYEKSLVFYRKVLDMMEAYQRKQLNEIGKDWD